MEFWLPILISTVLAAVTVLLAIGGVVIGVIALYSIREIKKKAEEAAKAAAQEALKEYETKLRNLEEYIQTLGPDVAPLGDVSELKDESKMEDDPSDGGIQ